MSVRKCLVVLSIGAFVLAMGGCAWLEGLLAELFPDDTQQGGDNRGPVAVVTPHVTDNAYLDGLNPNLRCPLEYTFDATESLDWAGNQVTAYIATSCYYEWDFGDGTPIVEGWTTWTPEHVYYALGTYTVTLTLTSSGETDTTSVDVPVGNHWIAVHGVATDPQPSGDVLYLVTIENISQYPLEFASAVLRDDSGFLGTASRTYGQQQIPLLMAGATDVLERLSIAPTGPVIAEPWNCRPAPP